MLKYATRLLAMSLFGVLLVSCLPSFATAQDADLAPLVAQTQNLLKNFACPPGASADACDTLRTMITSGNEEIALQFSPLFGDAKTSMGFAYVVFDSASNNFWIISVRAARTTDKGFVMKEVSYAHYNHGQLQVGSLGSDIPVTDETTYSSKKDGVTVTYHQTGNVSVSTQEVTERSNGATLTFSIEVNKTNLINSPTTDETITAQSGDIKVVHSGKALRFLSGNLD